MRRMKFLLILILGLFVLKTNLAFGQIKLPNGLYKLDDSSTHLLTLDGKTYHTNGKAIALAKNMSKISVTPDRTRKDYYNLNIELNAEATQNLKNISPGYGRSNYLGVIVSGELVSAPMLFTPIATGKISIGGKSRPELEEIAKKLKAGK